MTDGQEIIMEITAMAHDGRGSGAMGAWLSFVPGAVRGTPSVPRSLGGKNAALWGN